MNEFDLIARITGSLPSNSSVVVGAGDDCAVLESGQPGRYLLFKTDAVVQGVHFTPEATPEQIGHKALGRCLSDIAAMAGKPTAALVTIALPKDFKTEFVERIYAGINRLAQRHGVAIVGGETTSNPERLLISIALLGEVQASRCILRSGAKDGDALFVTGDLGGSRSGKHLDFEPRLEEAQWLAGHFPVHAMIDLSDGLAGDLRHILRRSGVGAELLERAIPISRAARLQARAESPAKPPLLAALTDGEDFELLFAAPGQRAVPLLDAWKRQFPTVRLSCIGRITAARGLKLRDKTGIRSLEAHGYVHFA
ncbi:MAG TPA: thiamine-phosphate kinase [Candidatus Saccharimonadales bacterium]|nr:thiamine-phosphate kinase [Candidatus Saccharimonadales bacterium]